MSRNMLSDCAKCKCPACGQGEMFVAGAFSKSPLMMHKNCTSCGVKYEVEPGFFWGAMFVSYGFSVTIVLSVWVVFALVFEEINLELMLGVIIALNTLFFTVIFRWSRSIFLYLFSGIKRIS